MDSWPRRDPRCNVFHVAWPDGYAPAGGSQVLVCKVKENCAAPPDCSRRDIEIQYADDIIKMVFAPKCFCTGVKRQPNATVVVPGQWIVAPSIIRGNVLRFFQASAPAVGSPQPVHDRETPDGRYAVSFATLDAQATPTDCAFDDVRADGQQASVPVRLEVAKLANNEHVDLSWPDTAKFQHALLTARA